MKRSQLVGIGVMVVVALALVVRALFFLHPHPGDGGTKIRVRFQNIDKIAKGSRVTFAGRPVGEVEKIIILQDALDIRPKGKDAIYPYELILSLDSSVKVYSTDIITAKTSGLMGERFIAIIPQPVKGDMLLPVGPEDILFAYEPASVEETFHDISTTAKRADTTLESLIDLIQRNQGSIQQTTTALEQASKQLNELISSANKHSLATELALAAREARQLLCSINKSKGTLGRVIHNPELYNESLTCLKRANFLIESLGSYGLFFHTNSSWQRKRRLMEEKWQQSATERNVSDHTTVSDSASNEHIVDEIERLIQQSRESQTAEDTLELIQRKLDIYKHPYNKAAQ